MSLLALLLAIAVTSLLVYRALRNSPSYRPPSPDLLVRITCDTREFAAAIRRASDALRGFGLAAEHAAPIATRVAEALRRTDA